MRFAATEAVACDGVPHNRVRIKELGWLLDPAIIGKLIFQLDDPLVGVVPAHGQMVPRRSRRRSKSRLLSIGDAHFPQPPP